MSDDTEKKSKYGCLSIRPGCLQFVNTIRWHVLFHCIFSFCEGFIVNGVINIIIVTLEKRYELSSKESGMIASANDFGAAALLMIVGYLGTYANKPRLMGAGMFLMSIGCLVFALPQFIGEKYTYTISSAGENSTDNVCVATNSSTATCSIQSSKQNYKGYYSMLLLGNALIGIGAVPSFTLGITYIEENSKTRNSPFYFGCTFCCAALGVAVGYIVGAQSLSIFVDVDKVDISSLSLSPLSPQWVGAWWICILAGMGGFILVLFPIIGYPRRLPGYDELQKEKVSEAQTNSEKVYKEKEEFGKSIKHLPKSLLLLAKNPAFVFIILGGTVEIFIIGGLATFGAKLFQEFFNVDILEAGNLMGFITVPGSAGGMLFGGYVVKKFNLKCRGIIRFSCACLFFCMLLGPSFLATCPSRPIAGVSRTYPSTGDSSFISSCNSDCGCSTKGYEPICDENQIVYFSPCHAGCKSITTLNETKIYQDCSCINSSAPSMVLRSGTCSGRCTWFYVFCVLLFLMMFLTFSTTSPTLTAMFRCIPQQQRSLGLGIQLTFGRLLGTLPGPIFLGAILDSTCSVWQDNCGVRGSCWIYDKWPLGLRLMLWWMGTKFTGVVLLFIASLVYKPEVAEDSTNAVEVKNNNAEKAGTDNPVFNIFDEKKCNTRL
ncbi:solute carrier organic anion transporter family member 4A1-like [Saccostrea cucullata]|uniref:solute carrier organic anion transporter family member 4A1-like n=1 Tax=Saccostrea cuccullata TaxID=36930 RepID=UPI002ED26915